MQRDVSAHLEVAITAPTTLEFQIAAARHPNLELNESLVFELDGRSVTPWEIFGPHGTRIHKFSVGPGTLRAHYTATVLGTALPDSPSDYDLALYLRPSRFAESDKLLGFANTEFGSATPSTQLAAEVSAWVGRRIRYVAGSSDPIDGAVETLLSGAGVCRDFAHLVVALLRAVKVPARVVSVYAPGCVPMDFHAVAEAYVDGIWRAFDATGLAPRSTLVRIATGRDASDVAFLDNHGGEIGVNSLQVNATVDGFLPFDDNVTPTSVW
ncbi:transglutaminase-like domain-containing protein [Nocardia brasiliensis]|uniref:transglutaminase-like domain-containing protein n=1 Tax=Nocardia brasiliensis TaxID=37326 RepID=UPI0004A72FB3|nr:transglutaminase family protein [Nocardia brasiliensis]MBF6548788.1 transglutaminase family protein [Nocardia brasiliensis]